jgi:hypothetical protein
MLITLMVGTKSFEPLLPSSSRSITAPRLSGRANIDNDNQQFWTVPGERDERLRGRHTDTVTEPEPDEYELYDLTNDPIEARNLAHPSNADDRSRALQQTMLTLLGEQLAAKRLTPSTGEVPGYRPPAVH